MREVLAFRSSHRYAENAIHEPKTTRQEIARIESTENRAGSNRVASPRAKPHASVIVLPAIITIAFPTNGRRGSRAPRATSDPAAQLIEAAVATTSPETGTPPTRAPSTSIAAPENPRTSPITTRGEAGRPPANRSHSAIQSGTSARIRATVPDGTVRSASTTDPLPPAIKNVPTVKAASRWLRPIRSPIASPRRSVIARSSAGDHEPRSRRHERREGLVRDPDREVRRAPDRVDGPERQPDQPRRRQAARVDGGRPRIRTASECSGLVRVVR